MELVATIGASMAGSGAASATVGSAALGGTTTAALLNTAAGSAAGFSAMAGTAGAGLTLSTLASGMSLASGALSLFGDNGAKDALASSQAQARALELQSQEERIAAKQEELAAKESGNAVLDRLNRTLASQRLAFSANGVDGDFGSAKALAENSIEGAGRDLALTREDTVQRLLARRRQSSELLRQRGIVLANGMSGANAARRQGAIGAVTTFGNYLDRRIARG